MLQHDEWPEVGSLKLIRDEMLPKGKLLSVGEISHF
jgi:hypothetical protein